MTQTHHAHSEENRREEDGRENADDRNHQATGNMSDAPGSHGEKFGNDYGFGREGEHVEPQGYDYGHPQGSNYVNRYSPPENSAFLMEEGPETGRGPRNCPQKTGGAIDDVCGQLTRHGRLDASRMEVHMNDTVVVLRGSVASQEDRQIAEQIARATAGISGVDNQLTVETGAID